MSTISTTFSSTTYHVLPPIKSKIGNKQKRSNNLWPQIYIQLVYKGTLCFTIKFKILSGSLFRTKKVGYFSKLEEKFPYFPDQSHCPKLNMIRASDNEGKFHSFLMCRI